MQCRLPLGGNTHHLLASVPAKRQQLASTCWYLCSAEVRRRGLQSTRRTATTMPAPAAGAASGLAVPSRASRLQPRPPMHWRRPCALIWSIWSPISCRWQAGGSSTSMLPEHGQLMKYDVQDTSTSSYTHGSATSMVRWQPLCRINAVAPPCHATTRVERAAEATSARVASTGTAESGRWQLLRQPACQLES